MECEIDIGGEGEPISDCSDGPCTLTEDTRCGECDRVISAGTEHDLATGDLDGEPFEFHTCKDCHHIAIGLQVEGRDYGFLWAQLEDHGGENSGGAFEHFNSGCLGKIHTASAKAYLVERFRKWKGIDHGTDIDRVD